MGTGTCWRCGASEDGALSSYGDPRDAEIARLRADLAAHKRALAAGPAAVRRQENVDVNTREAYARVVEVAQAAAMKEKS